jgi:Tfp pilus assembly protein PilF
MRKCLFGVSVAALALSSSQSLVAQSDGDQQLGSVNFKTSCNEVAQRRFDRGMRYQHSYWYVNAKEVFEDAIKADPTCAMAYWGIALTLMDNPHNAIPGLTSRPASPQSRKPRRSAARLSANATTSTPLW